MKKNVFAFLAAFLLTAALSCPALADVESGLLPRIIDEADLLSESEESSLMEKLDEVSESYELDVVVVTVDGMDGKTATEYADDFYDANGYGMGEERDGILLLVSMEERDWGISTCGYGITAFADAGQEYMTEKFLPDLSKGAYYDAFMEFAELCGKFAEKARAGKPYDAGNLPKEGVRPIWILLDLLIGFAAAFIITSSQVSRLKSVRKQKDAQNYEVPGSRRLLVNVDRFMNRTVSQRVISSGNGNSGGSSTHTSESGTRHGGSGGKF